MRYRIVATVEAEDMAGAAKKLAEIADVVVQTIPFEAESIQWGYGPGLGVSINPEGAKLPGYAAGGYVARAGSVLSKSDVEALQRHSGTPLTAS